MRCNNLLQRVDGGLKIALVLDDRGLGQARKLAIDPVFRNACQIVERRVRLVEIRHLLGHQQAGELIVWIDEEAESQARRDRLAGVIIAFVKRHRNNRIGDHPVRSWQGIGLAFQRIAHLPVAELARQPRRDDHVNCLPIAKPGVKGGKLEQQVRAAQRGVKTDDPLFGLGRQSEMFGHQRGVKPEIGRHAAILADGKTSCLEKRRNPGITAAGRNKAPPPDDAGKHK